MSQVGTRREVVEVQIMAIREMAITIRHLKGVIEAVEVVGVAVRPTTRIKAPGMTIQRSRSTGQGGEDNVSIEGQAEAVDSVTDMRACGMQSTMRVHPGRQMQVSGRKMPNKAMIHTNSNHRKIETPCRNYSPTWTLQSLASFRDQSTIS